MNDIFLLKNRVKALLFGQLCLLVLSLAIGYRMWDLTAKNKALEAKVESLHSDLGAVAQCCVNLIQEIYGSSVPTESHGSSKPVAPGRRNTSTRISP